MFGKHAARPSPHAPVGLILFKLAASVAAAAFAHKLKEKRDRAASLKAAPAQSAGATPPERK